MSKLRINSFKSDPTGWIGSGVMLAFSAIAVWRWSHSGLIFFALTGLRDLFAAYFLLARHPYHAEERSHISLLLPYVSSALPLLYLVPPTTVLPLLETAATLLAIAGYTLATLALLDLGSAFGVSPANRGHIRTGVYKWIRHPMYLGYGLAEAGTIVLVPNNAFLLALSLTLYCFRAKEESHLIAQLASVSPASSFRRLQT